MALTKISTDGVKDDAITKAKIPADQIEASEIAANAVGASELANDAVDTNAIQDEAVTLAKLPHGDANNDGKFLRANNGADPSFESLPASGVSVSGNVDNRVATCDGSNLVGESGFTHNSATQDTQIDGSNNAPVDLIIANTNNSQSAATARISVQAGDNANNGGQLELECNGQYHGFESRANGNLYISDNGTTKLTLDSNGHLAIADGNLILASGHGIDFSATANTSASNASMQNELFADYEVGTWHPVIRYYNNGAWLQATMTTEGSRTGCYYVKIGNMCYFHIGWDGFEVQNSSYAVIGGLPFGSAGRGSCLVHYTNMFGNHQNQGGHISASGADQVEFYRDSNQWNSIVNNSSGKYIYACGRYKVA